MEDDDSISIKESKKRLNFKLPTHFLEQEKYDQNRILPTKKSTFVIIEAEEKRFFSL